MQETSSEEKVHTKFVVGGRYRRELRDRITNKLMDVVLGTLTGGMVHNSGRREGLIFTSHTGQVHVEADTDSLDQWTLDAEPSDPGIIADLQRRMNDLQREVESLRGLIGVQSAASPTADLTAARSRGRLAESPRNV